MTEREKRKEKLYCIKRIELWLDAIKYDDFSSLSDEHGKVNNSRVRTNA